MDDGVRETFEKLGKLLELRGDCEVFFMVKSVEGLEVVTNVTDYITERGMLKVAEESAIDRQHMINAMMRSEAEREQRAAMAAMTGMKKPVGGVN